MKTSKIIIVIALLIVAISAALAWYVFQNAHLFIEQDNESVSVEQDDTYDWSVPVEDRIPSPSDNVLFLTLQNNSKNSVFNAPIIIFHTEGFHLGRVGDDFLSPLGRMFDFPVLDEYMYDMLLKMKQKRVIFDFEVTSELMSDQDLYSVSFGPFTAPQDMYVSVFAADSDTNDGYAYIDSVKIYDASTNKMVSPTNVIVVADNYDAGLEKNSSRSGFAAGKYDPNKKDKNIGNGEKTKGKIQKHPDMQKESLRLIMRTQTVKELEKQKKNAEAVLQELKNTPTES